MKNTATVTEFRRRTGYFVARAKGGSELIITERGRPVARLVRYGHGAAASGRPVEESVMRRGTGCLGPDFWDLPRPADPEGRVLAALIDERRGT